MCILSYSKQELGFVSRSRMLPLAVNYDPPAAIKLSFPATTRARSAVGPSLSLAQRSGTHCQTSSETHRYRLTVSVASLKHSCLQTRSSVHSALEIFVDALYKSTFTYLLTYFVIGGNQVTWCAFVFSSCLSASTVSFSLLVLLNVPPGLTLHSQEVTDSQPRNCLLTEL